MVETRLINPEFVGFGKIPRFQREIIITEKIDGTNAQILITDDGDIRAGSRNRWITPTDDNYGFAKWVEGNKSELLRLGPGRHFGEWWGQGINRGYALKEKRFSLFNVTRWADLSMCPTCCFVVPRLFEGRFDTDNIEDVMAELRMNGSVAAPGFMKPEGIVIFHSASGYMFKRTLENDEKPKGA